MNQITRRLEADKWQDVMAGVKYLERARREGTMDASQERRYGHIKALLADALPVVERLGFAPPPVPLEDA